MNSIDAQIGFPDRLGSAHGFAFDEIGKWFGRTRERLDPGVGRPDYGAHGSGAS
jgi:hypothetical protein